MDFSDLPEAARDLIAAAELDAESILKEFQRAASELAAEAYSLGIDPTGVGYSPGTRLLELAKEHLAEGREEAAIHLFAIAAKLSWEGIEPDVATFKVKLNEI
jgi:hypothetical protein